MEVLFLRINYKILFHLLFLFFIPATTAICQEISFREYGVRDGLPQSQAYFTYQDSRGFIWIGTRNGLSRFDGIDFINYYRKDGLPSNSVICVFEDKTGNLWALSAEGLSKYTGIGFIFFPPGNEFKKPAFNHQVTATETPGRNFLLTNSSSVFPNKIILFEDGIYTNYSSSYATLDTIAFLGIGFDTASSDLLLIDSANQLWSWKNELLSKISQREVTKLYFDRGKTLLISGDSIFEYRDRKLFPHPLVNTTGRKEILLKHSISQNFINYFDGSEVISTILPFKAIGVFIDNEGTVWFSSESNIYRFLSQAFIPFSKNEVQITDIWTICMDNAGHLWLGSLYGDLVEYNGTSFIVRDDYKKVFPGSISFFRGSRLLSNGETWFSSNRGVLIWNGSSFSKLKGIPDQTQVCYIYEDRENHKIFLGTGNGVYIYCNEVVTYLPQYIDNDLGVVEGIVKDDSGFYWMSGHRGLVKFDGIYSDPVKEEILPEVYTYTIEKDSLGGIWISSEEGLFFKAKSDKHFRHGLPEPFNKPANTLKILDNSHLLVGRAADICLINLNKFYRNEKAYYRIFDKTDGYLGGDCIDNGIIKGSDGEFWILTSDNVIKFYPGKLRNNLISPRLNFTGFFYETDSLTWEAVKRNEFYFRTPSNIKLKRHQNSVQITYCGISTINPEEVKYIYKLDGFNNKWSLPTSKRSIIFDNLSPDEYSFHLKAINADGIETPDPITLNFSVQPAIWETTLFRILSLISVVIITILLTWYIIRRKQKLEEDEFKLKSELSRLQMNSVVRELDPHFVFNVISSVGSLIMKNEREAAYTYISKLSGLLRTVLREGSSMIKPLSEELNFVRHYCELQKLRFGERFTYIIDVVNDVDIQRELPKMTIQTFVENAVKHGIGNRKGGGRIDILLSHENYCLKIIVRDNGIGIIKAMKMKTDGTEYGLKTVRRVFEIMNQSNNLKSTIEIRDLNGTEYQSGTEVVVIIPDKYNFSLGDQFNTHEN